jgi:hypothetical protein
MSVEAIVDHAGLLLVPEFFRKLFGVALLAKAESVFAAEAKRRSPCTVAGTVEPGPDGPSCAHSPEEELRPQSVLVTVFL